MDKIALRVMGLSYSQAKSGAYALVLAEESGERRLPIIIGGFEAQSIAIELEGMKPSRPLTHDLFKSFANAFDVEIEEALIHNLKEGVFYAKLMCRWKGGEVIEIDTRTSDAIAISIRCGCPIYTYEEILSAAGIYLEEQEKEKGETPPEKSEQEITDKNALSTLPTERLNQLLQEAIEQEDYERASEIRDELKKRN